MSQPRRRLDVEITWGSLARVVAVVALAWLWLQLWELTLLLIVAVLMSVTLDPLVVRLQQRGLGRGAASSLTVLALTIIAAGFMYFAWSSLAAQAHLVGERVIDFEQELLARIPPFIHDALAESPTTSDLQSYLAAAAVATGRSLAHAAVIVLLALILTLYLLIEAEQTTAWLLAFVPPAHRGRARLTMGEARRVMVGYVAGNVATSIFATIFVLVALSVLHVPATPLLALLAGIFDFLPVIGFPLSAAPAMLLAMTVSGHTVLLVPILYALYHGVENYVIAPRVYGDRLKLSNLAVVLAFAVGAQIGGVIGALIALPVAAVYPAVERIWLRDQLGPQVVAEHRAIEEGD